MARGADYWVAEKHPDDAAGCSVWRAITQPELTKTRAILMAADHPTRARAMIRRHGVVTFVYDNYKKEEAA
jgi:hypothetical protein